MNSSLFLWFVNCFLIIIETVSIIYLASGFFHRKTADGFYIISFFLLSLSSILCVVILEAIPLARICCFIIICGIWTFLNYNGTFLKTLILSILSLSLQVVIDALVLYFAVAITSENTSAIYDNPLVYYTICYSSKLTILFVFVLIKLWVQKRFQHQNTQWGDWLRIAFIPFTIALIALFLSFALTAAPQFSELFFLCTLLLLILDVASVFLLNYLEKQRVELMDKAILEQNLKLEAEHIKAMEEAYAVQRKQTHDFNNQLTVLRSLADRGADTAEFSRYLGQILNTDIPSVPSLNTHRPVVDVILSHKMSLAKNKGIAFDLALTALSAFPLPDDALVIVLTNLIDNAIEACEKLPAGAARQILLKMQTKPSGAYLYIENPTAEPVRIHDGRIATTKDKPLAHGYGLKNVCAMLDKHKAFHAINYDPIEKTFCFSARAPLPT